MKKLISLLCSSAILTAYIAASGAQAAPLGSSIQEKHKKYLLWSNRGHLQRNCKRISHFVGRGKDAVSVQMDGFHIGLREAKNHGIDIHQWTNISLPHKKIGQLRALIGSKYYNAATGRVSFRICVELEAQSNYILENPVMFGEIPVTFTIFNL